MRTGGRDDKSLYGKRVNKLFTNKQLKQLIVPLIIEQLLSVLVGTMDVIMVSQVGEYATSGVSLVDSITNLLVQAFSAMATGGSVIAANYIGRRQPEKASEAAGQLIVSNAAVGVVLAGICLWGREFFLDTIYGSIAADVKDSAMIYFLITAFSYPFFAVYAGGAALCRAEGNSKITMKVAIITNLINVCGNALLVMGLRMGTAGVAIPTLLARAFGAFAMLVILKKQDHPIHFRAGERFRLNMPMIRQILKIGIPTGIDGSVFQVGKLLVASLIAGLGTPSIAANAVTNTLSSIVVIPGCAMGLSLITIVGQCIGAGEKEQAVRYTKKIMLWIHAASVLMSLIIGFGSGTILKLYNLSGETYTIAHRLVITYAIVSPVFWPEAFAIHNSLRAGGDAAFIMVVTLVSMWLFRIGLSYVFVKGMNMGVDGIWYAMYADWVVRGAAFVLRFKSMKWTKLLKGTKAEAPAAEAVK